MFEFIEVSHDVGITTIVLNRPKRLNAVHSPMHNELQQALDAFSDDPSQNVAIITGRGRAFCAGSDLHDATDALVSNRPVGAGYPRSGYAGVAERHDLTKPLIAAVNGVALGGGFEIALACDLIIASENARFGLPEPLVGAVALAGGVHRLARQIGLKHAMGLILTGRMIDAAEARELGILNAVVAADDLPSEALRWAALMQKASPLAVRASKEMVTRGLGERSVGDAIGAQADYPAYRALLASPDAREGPLAFSEKRSPRWSS